MTGRPDFDPIALLRQLEERAEQRVAGRSADTGVSWEWRGVGFQMGRYRLVVPTENVLEVHPSLTATRVPGTKPWLRGIIHVRGHMFPLVDLQAFLCGHTTPASDSARILIVGKGQAHREVQIGLLVDSVLGVQTFREGSQGSVSDDKDPDGLHACLNARFYSPSGNWDVLDLGAVLEKPSFLEVAA